MFSASFSKHACHKSTQILVILFCYLQTSTAQTAILQFLDSLPGGIISYIKDFLQAIAGRTADEEKFMQRARFRNIVQKRISESTSFPCRTSGFRSSEKPESVHKLMPGDIDVIAGMGDSLTAGNGIVSHNVLQLAVENRGLSFSVGGKDTWREYLTIPNILKEYNSNLIGYATTDTYTHRRSSQFNVAEIGAMSSDLPYEATILVKRIRNDPRVNITQDWKMVNLLMGANDFCTSMCYYQRPWDMVEQHRKDLYKTFDYLQSTLPRTIINMIGMPNLKLFTEFHPKSLLCEITGRVECSCLSGLPHNRRRKEFFKIMSAWARVEEEVANDPKYTTENFTIVFQPFLQHVTFPSVSSENGRSRTDFTFLAVDCFHVSQKTQAKAANGLWNNILQPVGNKSEDWPETFPDLLCPTSERPFIYTSVNSLDNS